MKIIKAIVCVFLWATFGMVVGYRVGYHAEESFHASEKRVIVGEVQMWRDYFLEKGGDK
jgi:hypothetical protein